jgi:hypothetical protein
MEDRSKVKIAQVKELMLQYMISPKDAFRFVSKRLTSV